MKITWLGHSTFKIEGEKMIVIDPHDPSFGALPDGLTADIVTVSHGHHDHNYIAGVEGSPEVIDKAGNYDFDNIKIKGLPTFHDGVQGQERGNNIVFIYEIEGLKLAHLGDLGHIFTAEQLNLIGPIDILMIPVGGVYTIDADQAIEIVGQIKPKIVLPMHYKTGNLPASIQIAPVDGFIQKLGWKVDKVRELEINQSNISSHTDSIILFN